MDPTISPKAYWSKLKTFLNNKKIPCIPPIYYNNNYITDFLEKAQIFNDFFAKPCTLVENNSKLPTDSFKKTNDLLSTISFAKDDFAKTIKNLNPNKDNQHPHVKNLGWLNLETLRMANFPSNGKKLMLSQFIKKIANS